MSPQFKDNIKTVRSILPFYIYILQPFLIPGKTVMLKIKCTHPHLEESEGDRNYRAYHQLSISPGLSQSQYLYDRCC